MGFLCVILQLHYHAILILWSVITHLEIAQNSYYFCPRVYYPVIMRQ